MWWRGVAGSEEISLLLGVLPQEGGRVHRGGLDLLASFRILGGKRFDVPVS